MSELLRKGLRKRLEAHRYMSIAGRGKRGLMPHHVDALVEDLAPFIEELMIETKRQVEDADRSRQMDAEGYGDQSYYARGED